MKASFKNTLIGVAVCTFGAGIAAGGIYIGETDDAPGAALLGLAVLLGSVVVGTKIARRKC